MYFVCHMNDNTMVNFDGKSKYVDYTCDRMCIFRDRAGGTALGLVPYENIKYIEWQEGIYDKNRERYSG